MKKMTQNIKKHEINERLRIARNAQSKTMSELAALFKMPERTISNYERGISSPSVEYLKFLYTNFCINPLWIITGEGEMSFKQECYNPNEFEINRDFNNLKMFFKEKYGIQPESFEKIASLIVRYWAKTQVILECLAEYPDLLDEVLEFVVEGKAKRRKKS